MEIVDIQSDNGVILICQKCNTKFILGWDDYKKVKTFSEGRMETNSSLTCPKCNEICYLESNIANIFISLQHQNKRK